jgi:hypothetical protein
MSDRSVANEIGVHYSIVHDFRASGAPKRAPEIKSSNHKRLGKDGKRYRAVKPKHKLKVVWPTEEQAYASWQAQVLKMAIDLLDAEMQPETRQTFFAHIKRRYSNNPHCRLVHQLGSAPDVT